MKKFNLVKGLSTAVVAMALAVSFVLPAKAAPAAPAISLKYSVKDGQVTDSWVINHQAVAEGQQLMFNVYGGDDPTKSETGEWVKDEQGRLYFDPDDAEVAVDNRWGYADSTQTETTISRGDCNKPGAKAVVAYLFDYKGYEEARQATYAQYLATREKAYDALDDDNYDEYNRLYDEAYKLLELYYDYPKYDFISPASAPISIDATWAADATASVKSTSIQLNLYDDTDSAWTSGYEVYRKVGKKYQKVATVSKNIYVDQGLLSKTEYSYKIRPYYKDVELNKTIYGKYYQFEQMTKGSALNLKVTVQKTKNVKLSWKKVAGAVRYEIYRAPDNGWYNTSNSTEISKGKGNGFANFKLIKTVGKSKKSYVDKKTTANESYTYFVRAVLSKDAKVKGDSDTYIEDSAYVSFEFGSPNVTASYTDADGNVTLEWAKGYGIDGYVIFKEDKTTGKLNEITRLKKTATKYKFAAEITPNADGSYETDTNYEICAYKGTALSYPRSVTTTKTLGLVNSVTAKKVANGIQVSWSTVPGAAYYKVYRVPARSWVKNKDIGGYAVSGGTAVTEYVGASAPVAVDVAAWNAAIDAYDAAYEAAWKNDTPYPTRPVESRFGKLDATKTYYYQNYQYSQSEFTTTTCLDYSGEIYGYGYTQEVAWDDNDNPTAWATRPTEVNPDTDYYKGPSEGVSYQYYVIAYAARQKTAADYKYEWNTDADAQEDFADASRIYIVTPGTTTAVTGTKPLWDRAYTDYQQTFGCKKVASALTYTSVKAPAKVKIKSLSSSKKTVTIKFKKVKGATSYKIYRSTKKKGKYMCVGTSKKVSFKDSGLEVGTTYYYKVVAVKASESGADIEGKASAVKTIKAK